LSKKLKVTMIKIKALLSITASLFCLISSSSIANNDHLDETQYVKSNVSLNLMTSKYSIYNSSAAFVGLNYKPDVNKGTVLEYGYELNLYDYTYNGVDYHSFTNLRFGGGHQFILSNNISMTPMLGLSINGDIESESAATQGYTSLEFSYALSDEFSLVAESSYNFGSMLFEDSASVGIGFRYTPKFKKIISSPLLQKKTTPHLVTNHTNNEVLLEENKAYHPFPYTIQLGAYQSGSIFRFLEENAIDPESVYTQYVNGLYKIYYKGFNTITSARNALAALQSRGIEGWVLNTPE